MGTGAEQRTERLRRRQVHLDFHTAPEVPDVGVEFEAGAFAETIRGARVDSVTVFAKCHHGYSYHPTEVGTMHPGLGFDLLGAQVAALRGIGVRAPIYVSVGWDELMADAHPEWLQVDGDGRIVGRAPEGNRGWRSLDLATPYADHVLAQTAEVLERYGPVDGIFFDIVRQELGGTYNAERRRRMRRDGVDLGDAGAVAAWGLAMERDFLARAHGLVVGSNPAATVFFNSRLRVDRDPEAGSRAELPSYSHIEVESLPSGDWGYDHYPLTAGYFQTLARPMLGMTGIFHTAWGDFGSLKTAAALGYECARMVASGAACSVGDQLHPRGRLEAAAYRRLGEVYQAVEALEPWGVGAEAVAEVGVLLAETGARYHVAGRASDEGAMRMLLELHRPFQMLDRAAELSPARYRVLLAPDDLPFDDDLAAKIAAYVAAGGGLVLSHRAGLLPGGARFHPVVAELLGLEHLGDAAHSPDFLVAGEALGAPLTDYHQVLYERGSRVRVAEGAGEVEVLARVGQPLFDRTPEHYLSHRHWPYDRTSDEPAVAARGRVVYAHTPLFRAYRTHAVPAYRDLLGALLGRLVPDPVLVAPGLPTTAEVGLLRQPDGDRYVLHLIHAVPQRRGKGLDIVEDVLPLRDVRVGVRLPGERAAASVSLAPSGEALPHEAVEGVTWATVPRVEGHQVVVFG